MARFAVGQPVPRTEDPRLLRGGGRYLDDFNLPRLAHAHVLRSPHAHARITGIDTAKAKSAPGVIAVFTGADCVADGLGHHDCSFPMFRRDGSPKYDPPRPALVTDEVKVVGDGVALVVAETVNQAKDAAELIEVGYEALPIHIATADATKPGSPAIWNDCPDNECFFFETGDKEAVAAAFARADHVTELRFVINRVSANTMEPRACIGDYDAKEDRYTLYAGSQRPHDLRRQLAENIFHVSESQVRVVAGDVGGSFGMKGGHFPEYHLSVWAAKKIGRPVKWICERSEGLMTDDHDRDQVSEAALALDAEGYFLALRAKNICNVGAYLGPAAMVTPLHNLGGLAGTYTTPAIHVEVSGVFTNKNSTGPFRGAGRPEASFMLERLIDNAAREMNIDRAEIRRRNTIPADVMPFHTGLTYVYDCGEFESNLNQALKTADYAEFEGRRAEARDRGRLRGLGIANIIEQTSQHGGETAEIRFHSDAAVTLLMGSISHGQAHDTMFKLLLCDKLGLEPEDIRLVEADTDRVVWGGGTWGSRTAALGGSALVLAADKIIAKGRLIAAHLLEAAESDIDFVEGRFTVAGTDRSVPIKDVAKAAFTPTDLPADIEPGFFETATFAPGVPNFPNGCHICEVEIDPDTGQVALERYVVVDDVGTVINALTLEGQIHGGIGQAVGQALMEQIVFDEASGQILSGSFLDYAMPRAGDMCSFETANNPVPTKTNPVGAKGAGEAGNVGGLPALMNAIADALAPLGIAHIDMPASPENVWRAIQGTKAA